MSVHKKSGLTRGPHELETAEQGRACQMPQCGDTVNIEASQGIEGETGRCSINEVRALGCPRTCSRRPPIGRR